MTTRGFNYYDGWESEVFFCEKCGWSGTFYEGANEFYECLMECECPNCLDDAPRLAVVGYPTREETKANWHKLSQGEQQAFLARENREKRWAEMMLKEDSELPEIDQEFIVLTWHFSEEGNEWWTTIKHQNQIIWRELAFYEAYPRFLQALAILSKKYGDRLIDVVPTRQSCHYLWGDKLSASNITSCARAALMETKPKTRIYMAIGLAAIAHSEQTRKGSGNPFIVHPLEVGRLLKEAGCDEDTVISGFLHDVVEDSSLTLEGIARQFGYRVAGIVQGCSEPDKSLSWRKRKEHTLESLKTAPLEVLQVVIADKLSNVTSMWEAYQICGEDLWHRFNSGKVDQEWYYRGLVGTLGNSQMKEFALYSKLVDVVDKLFPSSSPKQKPRGAR